MLFFFASFTRPIIERKCLNMNAFKEIGKAVLVEGVKSVTLGAGLVALTILATGGVKGLKGISLQDLLD